MWSEDRKKLVDERGQLLQEAKGLHEQDEMSAEDKERFDGAIAKAEEIREQIEEGDQKAKADAEREERLAKAEQWEHESKGVLPGMSNGGSDPDAPPDPLAGTVLEQKGAYVGKMSDEHGWFPYCTKAEFNRNPQLKAIARPEYKSAWMDYMTRGVESKALTEGVDTEGGYLVPPDIASEIITRLPGLAIVEERARIVNTTRDRVAVPRLKAATTDSTMYTSAVSFTMVGETPAAATGSTEPAFEQLEINVYTAKMETEVSRNLLSDSAFDVEGLLTEEFRRAATLGKDDKYLTGTGANMPVGIVNDADISTVNSGDANTLTTDGWVELVHKLPAQYRPGAEIALSRDALEVTAKLQDGNGRYYLDAMNGGISAGTPPTILGVPYRVSDFLDSVSAGNIPAIYGNFGFYWAVIRAQLSIQVLREVFARQNENGYVGFLRFGGAVTVPEAFRTHTVSA